MNILCQYSASLCKDPATPLSNFSAETPDSVAYIGRFWTVGNYTGGSFNGQVVSFGSGASRAQTMLDADGQSQCLAYESEEQADLCAFNTDQDLQTEMFPDLQFYPDGELAGEPEGGFVFNDGTIQFVPNTVPSTIYWNEAQACPWTCPDGSLFTFTLPAHRMSSSISQDDANAKAYAQACKVVGQQYICLGSLSRNKVGTGLFWSLRIVATSPNLPIGMEITTGLAALYAAGFSVAQSATTLLIEGTPTSIGTINFTVVASNSYGATTKNFSLQIWGITNTPPDGTTGVPYTFAFTQSGGTSPIIYTLSGSLPAGLTMTPAGVISGTPT